MTKIKILGVCGSPIKRGNTEALMKEALKAAGDVDGIDTGLVTLAGRNINDCIHCNWCLKGQKEGQFCGQKDGMTELYPMILAADGLMLASPVYFGRLSGHLAVFIDRLRVFMHGNYYHNKLKDKVGAALAVSWFRGGGAETTVLSINYALWGLGMLTVPSPVSVGGVAVATLDGTGKFDLDDKNMVLKDEHGLKSARQLGKRVAETAKIIRLGKEALAGGQAGT